MTSSPINAAMTAFGLMTAVHNDDLETPRAVLAELSRDEMRLVIWGLLGSAKHLLDYIADDFGDEEFQEAWRRAGVDIAAKTT